MAIDPDRLPRSNRERRLAPPLVSVAHRGGAPRARARRAARPEGPRRPTSGRRVVAAAAGATPRHSDIRSARLCCRVAEDAPRTKLEAELQAIGFRVLIPERLVPVPELAQPRSADHEIIDPTIAEADREEVVQGRCVRAIQLLHGDAEPTGVSL